MLYFIYTDLTSFVFLISAQVLYMVGACLLIIELNKIRLLRLLRYTPNLILLSVLASLFSLTLRNSQIQRNLSH